MEHFICGESRIWSVFQAACSKRSGWSRPLWRSRCRKLAERRCPCEPLDGFTLTLIIFEKQLSTAHFVFMIWVVLGSIMTTMLVQPSSSGEVLNTLNLLSVAELTEHRREKRAKMTNGRNLLRVRGLFSDLLRMSVGVPGRKQNPRFVSHKRQSGSQLRLKPTPSSGVRPAEDEGLMEALFFSCQHTGTAGLTCRESGLACQCP